MACQLLHFDHFRPSVDSDFAIIASGVDQSIVELDDEGPAIDALDDFLRLKFLNKVMTTSAASGSKLCRSYNSTLFSMLPNKSMSSLNINEVMECFWNLMHFTILLLLGSISQKMLRFTTAWMCPSSAPIRRQCTGPPVLYTAMDSPFSMFQVLMVASWEQLTSTFLLSISAKTETRFSWPRQVLTISPWLVKDHWLMLPSSQLPNKYFSLKTDVMICSRVMAGLSAEFTLSSLASISRCYSSFSSLVRMVLSSSNLMVISRLARSQPLMEPSRDTLYSMWPSLPQGEYNDMTDSLWPLSRSLKALDFTTFMILQLTIIIFALSIFAECLLQMDEFQFK